MDNKVRLFKPFLDDSDRRCFAEAFDASWLGLGEKVYEFEKAWSSKSNAKYSVALNSATAALHIACQYVKETANIKDGNIIVPSLTFVSSVSSIIYAGLNPIFVDVDPDSLTIDCAKLESLIDKKTVAIMAVHYGGEPCRMKEITHLAKKYNLMTIEDCAHTQLTDYHGTKLGMWGDIGCFSFEEKKGMTTGDGGMLVTKNADIYDYAKQVRWLGISKDTWSRDTEEQKNIYWHYDINYLGYKYNMNNLAASLGLSQLKKLDFINSQKRKFILNYLNSLKSCNNLRPLLPYSLIKQHDASYWLFGVRCKNSEHRNLLMTFLRNKNIDYGMHFTPINEQPYFRRFNQETPVAHEIAKKILTLPLSPAHLDEEIEYVIHSLLEFDGKF